MEWHKDFPILIIDDEMDAETAPGRALRDVADRLEEMEFAVIDCLTLEDGWLTYLSRTDVGCVLIDMDLGGGKDAMTPTDLVLKIRARNDSIPMFVLTERINVADIPTKILREVDGYIWKTEDTAHFIAGKIEMALEEYQKEILPPFFEKLVEYSQESKFAWHTPGHAGGVAFLKSHVGRKFFQFFGENTLRSDLSVSVPELGSLMEHSGVVGDSAREAARNFKADKTWYVTNGTSTANKMVQMGTVTPGDVVIVDRNCHKSHLHGLIMCRAIPLYFIPSRNDYGIIGPIHASEFTASAVKKKIKESPLVKEKDIKKLRLATITNSTYDGLCYNVDAIKKSLKNSVECLHFDEAWYAYAAFHPIYEGRYGMCPTKDKPDYPSIFATQSTHKLLAAFSQASMIHYKDSHITTKKKDDSRRVDQERFSEAYMMQTSTSPQYGIIASLDVASRMMEGAEGRALVQEGIDEAVAFRDKMVRIGDDPEKDTDPDKNWWFGVWQPDMVAIKGKKKRFCDAPKEFVAKEPSAWTLKPGEEWHGFTDLEKDSILLDPIKVTLLTPGINRDGSMQDWGIPAAVVVKFLMREGIVDEKTGHYSFLLLFSMGVTRGKSGTLIAKLFLFKQLYDKNAPVCDVFPDLSEKHPDTYGNLGLKDLCQAMHRHLKDKKLTEVVRKMYETLPRQEMTPADAYDLLVKGKTEQVRVKKMMGRIPAVMLVPYPPGIPVIMPGERLTKKSRDIVDYLVLCEEFDNTFPGFETETHGVILEKGKDGKTEYLVNCLTE